MTKIALGDGLDHEGLWRGTRALLAQLSAAIDRDAVLDECLDVVVELLNADRGMILLGGPGESAVVVNARKQRRPLTDFERQEVSRSLVQTAVETQECVLWSRFDADSARMSLHEMGVFYALAAPLRLDALAGGMADPMGAVYVDFRGFEKQVGELHRQFLDAAAMLLAGVVLQQRRVDGVRTELQRQSVTRTSWGADTQPCLDELLRPPSMAAVRDEVLSAVDGDSPVLIQGESGTGKTILAAAIAHAGNRAPVVRATLGASDDLNTITSELFGHERGAFSGAVGQRKGVAEFASGGTLILDEILNLPAPAQQLLLDFTQFGTFRPLGYSAATPKRAEVRIIAATNGDLARAIREGRFRQDLFYRLAGLRITMPPLRERRQDIPTIADSFLRRHDPGRPWRLSARFRRLLTSSALGWEGNVRQLENALRRARERALRSDPDTATLEPEHVAPIDIGADGIEVPHADAVPDAAPGFVVGDDLLDAWVRLENERVGLDAVEARIIQRAVTRNGGVVAHAARELGVPRTTLLSRMNALGIVR